MAFRSAFAKLCLHNQCLQPDTEMTISLRRDTPLTGAQPHQGAVAEGHLSSLPSREKQQHGEGSPHQDSSLLLVPHSYAPHRQLWKAMRQPFSLAPINLKLLILNVLKRDIHSAFSSHVYFILWSSIYEFI